MVIKKGKTETEKTIEEMKLPKWLDDLITKKWFFYVATAVVLVLFVGFSLPANTRDNVANAIFAKTADSSAALGPPSGSGNPPITGTATPSRDGQKTTVNSYASKFDQALLPNFNANGANAQGIALNNIPSIIYFEGKIISIKNLKGDGNYLYGYISSTVEITSRIAFTFFDENGNLAGEGTVGPSFQYESPKTRWTDSAPDSFTIPKGKELYFRILKPNSAKYLKIKSY